MNKLTGIKNLITLLFCFIICSKLFAVDLSLHIYPAYDYHIKSFLNDFGGFSANLGIDIAPITIRERDKIFFSGEFSYSGIPVKNFPIQSILDGEIGAGYNFRINDRFALFGQVSGGLWLFTPTEELKASSASGLLYGGRAGAEFYITPSFSVSAFAGYKCFYTRPEPLFNDIQAGLGIKINLSKGLSSSKAIVMEEQEVEPLFPVFFTHYSENPFGAISFINSEENAIYNVEVSVFVESYMTTPFVVYTNSKIQRGENFTVDLLSMFNENILDLLQPKNSEIEITVSYYSLGKKLSSSFKLPLTALSRNSMTWEDDRRAAAFVSGKDATAHRFARQVKAAVRNNLRSDIPQNIQYAAAIFGALKSFGINYVVDPSSAFTDNVGTAAVDFLQFPYQTLLYHGGDCDDLTILNCSLLEALGIETAFITVPGHIFMAFDSGIPVEKEASVRKGYYIEANGKLWVPVEITLSQDTFSLAWSYGAREWRKAGDNAILIPLKEAWAIYKPISVPGSDVVIDIPDADTLVRYFKEARYY